MLGLYLHIPFCSSICNYCNFNRGLFDADLKVRYVDALEREILAARSGRPEAADTLYFGGGTPSLLEPPPGCLFRQRCPRATVVCTADPTLAGGAHAFRCHHPLEAA